MSVEKSRFPDIQSLGLMPRAQSGFAPFAMLGLTAAAYFVIGKVGLQLAVIHESASAIWPATGLALALLLVWGPRLWPAILAGAFLVNITTAGNVLNAAMIATGNTLEAVTGAWLVNRYARGKRAFERPGDIVRLWFLACMGATLISATIGVASLCITGIARWSSYIALWRTWWLGDAVGGFVASALILLWLRGSRVYWNRGHVIETTLVMAATILASVLVFHGWTLNRSFYVLPILLWSAFRLGRRETAGVILVLGAIGSWGTLSGKGPFANHTAPNDALLLFQSYLAVLAVTNLTVAAVVEERSLALARLHAARDDLERRVQERTVMLSTANAALREEMTERRALEDRVTAAERERADNMRDLAAFVQGAQEDERRRVARDLHDDLGQRLAALKLSMELFDHDVAKTNEPYHARLQNLVGDVDRIITEVRRLSYNLRPLALDDFGLTVALKMLCREFEKLYDLKTDLRVSDGLPPLQDTQIDIALYRVAQNALSNVARHANARNVSIDLFQRDGSVVLAVEDDGRGFDVSSLRSKRDGKSGGLGLIGMRERSEMLGGTFKIQSSPDHGTRVEVQIPMMAADPGPGA